MSTAQPSCFTNKLINKGKLRNMSYIVVLDRRDVTSCESESEREYLANQTFYNIHATKTKYLTVPCLIKFFNNFSKTSNNVM